MIATLESVPPLVVARRFVPAVSFSEPLLIVPPRRLHEPVVPFRVIVLPVLVIVPVTFTVRAEVVNVPIPPVALNVPPMLKVPPVPVTVPAFVQLVGLTLIVPAVTCSVPLFVSVLFWIVRVCPDASAVIRPLFTSVAVELLLMFRPPPDPAASRTTADGPNVTVPTPP